MQFCDLVFSDSCLIHLLFLSLFDVTLDQGLKKKKRKRKKNADCSSCVLDVLGNCFILICLALVSLMFSY